MNTFSTHQEYLQAKIALSEYDMAADIYMQQHKTNGIPEEVYTQFPHADVVNNDMRGNIEVYEFIHDTPKKYFLYIDEQNKKATTWNGKVLGCVRFGSEYQANFGDKRQSIDVYAINGVKYHGTYYKSAGNYARVKAYKSAL